MWRFALAAPILVCLLARSVEAGTVTLTWDRNPEPDIAGYLVSYGTASHQYTGTIDVGQATVYQFSEPDPSVTYYLAVRAYNTAGAISIYSNEVVTTPHPVLRVTGLSSNKPSPQPVGTSIVFSATANGGTPPYQFKWWIDNGASSIVGQQWSTNSNFAWVPTAAGSNYTIRVWARNAGSTTDAPDNSAAVLSMDMATAGGSGGAGAGSGLTAEYFNDSSATTHFTTPVLTRTDATVDFNWGADAPAGAVRADNFSVRWTGQILAPTTGNYTFTTVADDGVRLWVNGQLAIDNWVDQPANRQSSPSIALTAGIRYDIRMEYYENGGLATARLLWTQPGQPESVIPQANLYPSCCQSQPPGTGLSAQYFNDLSATTRLTTAVLSRTDASVDFEWGVGSPAAAVQVDRFSVRWTGQLLAPTTGNYTFATVSDDGVRLWVNGQLVIDNWIDHGPTRRSSPSIALTAGVRYNIRMEYYENGGGATARFLWTRPGQQESVVPQANLYP